MTTYTPTRPIMTAAELATHHRDAHGRNYLLSDDGYDDMEVAAKAGWTVRSSWGRDGWDLGTWPYVVLSTRTRDDRFELQSVCEGDHDVYSFDTEADLHAAVDYLFLWYMQSKGEPAITVDREALDVGEVTVPDEFRGPVRFHLEDNA